MGSGDGGMAGRAERPAPEKNPAGVFGRALVQEDVFYI